MELRLKVLKVLLMITWLKSKLVEIMYALVVIECVFRPTKYSKATPELLQQLAHINMLHDGKHWVCKCCNVSLSKGILLVQAKANGMGVVLFEPLEQRLISLCHS